MLKQVKGSAWGLNGRLVKGSVWDRSSRTAKGAHWGRDARLVRTMFSPTAAGALLRTDL